MDKVRAYDRARGNRQSVEYRKSESCKTSSGKAKAKWAASNNHKRWAQDRVVKAIKSGFIEKAPCYVCDNKKSEAHHENYNYPLDIIWFCDSCHKERHKELRETERLKRFLTA